MRGLNELLLFTLQTREVVVGWVEEVGVVVVEQQDRGPGHSFQIAHFQATHYSLINSH